MPEKTRNTLSIGLTESAVFLRTNDMTGRNRNQDSRPSLLRGLLTLDLVKPTRISSIQIELQAKASTSWPEGIGARRIEISEEHKVFSATAILFRAAGPASRRTASIGPGTQGLVDDSEDDPSRSNTPTPRESSANLPNGEPSSATSLRQRLARAARRVSADAAFFQRNSLSYQVHDPPTPSPIHTPTQSGMQLDDTPAQHLEDVRNALRADLTDARMASSSGSSRDHSGSRSRRPSMEDVPEQEPAPSPPPPVPSPRSANRKRFSLSSVSSALKESLKTTNSPTSAGSRTSFFFNSKTKEQEISRGRALDKLEGRRVEPDEGSPSTPVAMVNGHKKEKRLSLNLLRSTDQEEKKSPDGDGWKEFKKGTYTYPISFAIPGHAPPSLDCQYGSVVWRVKAAVHRPGTFTSKLAASREIVVVAAPTEDDTEGTDNIIVERLWDQQMQYLISISGRSFYVGGTIPVSFTMMPFAKVKIFRIAVFLEEKIDYHTQFKRVARTDPVGRIVLLSLKDDSKEPVSILPLESENVDAFRSSPLYALVTEDDSESEMAENLMGPGPWTFHQELQLPPSCKMLHFTNKNKRSNITVAHTLKLVIRVQRGDDEAMDERTGKRKLFDIVIQTPVHILSCRCDPDWISLPHYSETLQDPTAVRPQCPCLVKHSPPLARGVLNRAGSSQSQASDSGASAVETSAVNPDTMPSLQNMNLLERSTEYERLVSGQVTESGEAPPAYQ